MAVTRSFKQQCPSCESMVLVKDVSMVGKKIECPRCKDRFVVEKPKVKKPADEDEAEEVEEAAPKVKKATQAKMGKKTTAAAEAKAAPAQAKVKRRRDENYEDEEEEEEVITEEVEDEDDEDEGNKKKKNKGKDKEKGKGLSLGSKKLQLQVGVAAVGVIVLALAGYFIIGSSPSSTGGGGGPVAKGGGMIPPPLPNPGDVKDPEKKEDPKKEAKTDLEPSGPPPDPAGPELTNLLPPDSEFVFRAPFGTIFDTSGPFRQTAFSPPGTFDEAVLHKQLGFPVVAIDEVLHARRFTVPAWSFTVVHVMDNLAIDKLTKAMDLKPAAAAIKGQEYFQVGKQRLVEQLGGIGLGVPPSLRFLAAGENRPLYLRLHNRQTLIFADETPMVAFLQAEGQFPYADEKGGGRKEDSKPGFKAPMPNTPIPNAPMIPPPPGKEPGKEPGKDPMAKPGAPFPDPAKIDPGKVDPFKSDPGKSDSGTEVRASGTFMTIKPSLKKLIEQIEAKAGENDKILFFYASDLVSARIPAKKGELRETVLFHPAPVWDLTIMTRGDRSRWTSLAAGLIQKESRNFQYVNELECKQEADARDLQKELVETTAPQIGQFLLHLLEHKIHLPEPMLKMDYKSEQFPGGIPGKPPVAFPGKPPGGAFPDPNKGIDPFGKDNKPPMTAPADASSIQVVQEAKKVSFVLNLVMDNAAYTRVVDMFGLLVAGAKAELALVAANPGIRHDLGRAGKELGAKGISEVEVSPGSYPPGAFPRPPSNVRSAKEPNHRVSWMAGLLPYLGQDALFRQINFKQSWRDPVNWAPGRTIVPEFLDPMYPDSSRYVVLPDTPVEYAATHFVGVAGVGLDAAFYPPGDPAFTGKRGILGYDQSASVEEVQKGRGLSNTILLIQVPHDSLVGPTPWMAGGGSTLRGVPEKNSIEPFVLTRDRDGKPMTHQGRAGTYALMADGSVRFLAKSTSDAVFQAMCTYKGPAPADFNLDKNSNTPLLPGPGAGGQKKLEKQDPTKTDSKKKTVTAAPKKK